MGKSFVGLILICWLGYSCSSGVLDKSTSASVRTQSTSSTNRPIELAGTSSPPAMFSYEELASYGVLNLKNDDFWNCQDGVQVCQFLGQASDVKSSLLCQNMSRLGYSWTGNSCELPSSSQKASNSQPELTVKRTVVTGSETKTQGISSNSSASKDKASDASVNSSESDNSTSIVPPNPYEVIDVSQTSNVNSSGEILEAQDISNVTIHLSEDKEDENFFVCALGETLVDGECLSNLPETEDDTEVDMEE